ncbi:Tat pathway signal protein [Desulfopila sp. IMCC35008]|uniref:Tat pathway signal protein n=1 Tax=Desulfopila sp. IMCC35008 TaxID=2653858 RepID=UPI0013D53D1B|nr:Tat pathway signal protein [Desulfopila sp. IMCC35008]
MEQEKDKRRSFLKHILAGSVVVAGAAAAVKPAQAREGKMPKGADDILYYESEDFKKYYKSLKS